MPEMFIAAALRKLSSDLRHDPEVAGWEVVRRDDLAKIFSDLADELDGTNERLAAD